MRKVSARDISLGFALSFASGCGLPAGNDTALANDPREAARARIEESIKGRLRDPASAIFNWTEIVASKNTACGTINSKNGFGGYTGPQEVVYLDGIIYDSSFPQKDLTSASIKCSERSTWEKIDELESLDIDANEKSKIRQGYLKALLMLKEIPGYTLKDRHRL